MLCGTGFKEKCFSSHMFQCFAESILFLVCTCERKQLLLITWIHLQSASLKTFSAYHKQPSTHTACRIPARSRQFLDFTSCFHGLSLGQKKSNFQIQQEVLSYRIALLVVICTRWVVKQGSFTSPKIRTTSCPYPFTHQHPTGHFPLLLVSIQCLHSMMIFPKPHLCVITRLKCHLIFVLRNTAWQLWLAFKTQQSL